MNCSQCGQPLAAGARFCGSCGTAVGASGDDSAVAAAPGNWWTDDASTTPAGSPVISSPAPPPAWQPSQPGAPSGPATGPTQVVPVLGGRKNPFRLVALVAAVIGVLVVAIFVVQALRGSGGASSPEAAVERLTDAVDHQDAVGLLNAINPGEVHDLGSVYAQLQGRLAKNGVKGNSPNVEAAVLGIQNVHFTNPQFEVERLAPDVAKVKLTGGSFDFDQVSSEPSLPDISSIRSGDLRDLSGVRETRRHRHYNAQDLVYRTTDSNDVEHVVEPFLMAVRRHGGWYVSLTYSAAQEAVEAFGLPQPDFNAQPNTAGSSPTVTASSPEESIKGIALAITNEDVAEGAPYLSGDEMQAVRDYAPSFQWLIGHNTDSIDRVTLRVDNLETSTEPASGGLVKVDIDQATGSAFSSSSESTSNFDWDGSCLRDSSTTEGDSEPSCLAARFKQLTGINKIFVLMKHSGGRYTLSPIATVLEYLRLASEHLPDSAIQRFTSSYRNAPVTGTVTPGQVVDASTNDAGFAVYTFDGTKGQIVGVNIDNSEDSSVSNQLLDPDGNTLDPLTYPSTYSLPKTGRYRLVAVGDAYAKTRFKLHFDTIVPKQVSLPVDEVENVAASQTLAIQFDVSDSTTPYAIRAVYPDLADTYNYTLLDPHGNEVLDNCQSECSLQPGRYTLFLSGSDTDSTAHLTIDQATLQFDNGSSAESGTISVDEAPTSYTLFTPIGQTITVTAACDSTVECTLAVGDEPAQDSGFLGGEATVTYTPTSSSTTVTVGSVDGAGGFTVSASG